jgi:choline kinase
MNPEPGPVLHAVILAAGLGTRLRGVLGHLPKPLLPVGGRTLLERSVERLREGGLASITVVAGHRADLLVDALRVVAPDARVVLNQDPGGNGSMRSLALAVEAWGEALPEEVLVVEGDLLYGRSALEALLTAPTASATVLCSTPTGAGDEVWVRGADGRVGAIGKGPPGAPDALGELVGLSRVGRAVLLDMVTSHRRSGADGDREHYEERLAAVASRHEVRALVVPDLVWAEVDHAAHLERVLTQVLPRLAEEKGARRPA